MNIIQVSGGEVRIPAEEGGAIEAFTFSISKQLSRMGHEVTILDRKYADTDPAIEYIEGIKIVRLSAKRFANFNLANRFYLNHVCFAFAVRKHLSKLDFDVIHVHSSIIGFILATLSKNLRSKLFYTSHSSRRVKDSPTFWDRIALIPESWLVRRVRRVTVPNELIRAKLIAAAKIKPKKIIVIHHDVDTSAFNPDLDIGDVRQRYGLDGKVIILFVGTINERKGVEYLVKAANIVVNEFGYKDTKFLLVGPTEAFNLREPTLRSPYLTKILDLIKNFGLQQNVKLTGVVPVDDLRKLYVASDIFVLPSLFDLSPRAIPEAMACGKPVLATGVGGIPTEVKDEQSGFLVDPMNERQLAERIKHLIDNPAKARRMGAYGREIAEKEFSSAKIAERLLQVYQNENAGQTG